MQAPTAPAELTADAYARIRDLVYERCGIALGEQRAALVRSRVSKLLRARQLNSYDAYIDLVESDASGDALCELIDAISTNTTHLFREPEHFQFLAERVREWSAASGARREPRRIWSAACSSGEEPYSLAMTCAHALAGAPVECKILATDISNRVLARARSPRFDRERLGQTPHAFRERYLQRVGGGDAAHFVPSAELSGMITFARFNLMTPQFPFRNPFDAIFCRNVMIYFDRPTQEGLVARLTSVLKPGGHLFIGHSESLNPIHHTLTYVRPAVYRKPESSARGARSRS